MIREDRLKIIKKLVIDETLQNILEVRVDCFRSTVTVVFISW
jgi:hypothetical protein